MRRKEEEENACKKYCECVSCVGLTTIVCKKNTWVNEHPLFFDSVVISRKIGFLIFSRLITPYLST